MCEIRRVSPNFIHEFAESDCNMDHRFLSPVNLKLDHMSQIELPDLKWLNMDSEPQSTKVANTGQTVIVSGSWKKNRPRITGGPLLTTYAFSQLHYHWGSDNTHGSEHSYNGRKVPLEMHAVFLKESCRKQEDALGQKDGAVIISYAYKLSDEPNPGIKLVCDELPHIPNPSQLIEMEDPVKLTTFVVPFQDDYFVYWGSVRTNVCKHILLWILCRKPYAVSEVQLEVFRSLFTSGHQPIMNNWRHVHSQGYEVFHINPSAYRDDVLYKAIENNVCKRVLTIERIIEMKKQQQRSRIKTWNSLKNRNSSILSLDQERHTENQEELLKNKKKLSCISLYSDNSNDQHRLLKDPLKKFDEASSFRTFNKPRRQSCYSKFFSEKNKKGIKTHEKIFKLGKSEVPQDVTSIKRNKNLIHDGEVNELKQSQSQYRETKQKHEHDYYNEEQEDSELRGTINPISLTELNESTFYSPYSEQIRKINELGTIVNDRDKLDVVQENPNWENFQNFRRNNEKEVKFCEELNRNTPQIFTNNICLIKNNNATLMDYKIKEHKVDDDTFKDCYKELNDFNYFSINNSKILGSNNVNKVVQDVGVNTLPFKELIMSMSEEFDHETKTFAKLISRISSQSTSADSNQGDTDSEDHNLDVGSCEKQNLNAKYDLENKLNPQKSYPVKYFRNEEKQISNTTWSSGSLSSDNSSTHSRTLSLDKKKSKILSLEEYPIRNSSSSSNQSDHFMNTRSHKKSCRTSSHDLWAHEKCKDERIVRPLTPSYKMNKNVNPPLRRLNSTNKPVIEQSTLLYKTSSRLSNESSNFQTSKKSNGINQENTKESIKLNKSLEQNSESRANSSHKKDEINHNQRSEENNEKWRYTTTQTTALNKPSTCKVTSISQTTNEFVDKILNRSSLVTAPSQCKIGESNTNNDYNSLVNHSEQNYDYERFSYGESTTSDEESITDDLTPSPSIQTRMTHKYEELQILKSNEMLKSQKPNKQKQSFKKSQKLKKQKQSVKKSSAKQTKSCERESKFLMCKDSLQMLDNKKTLVRQSTRIPLRKSLLQKNNKNNILKERPQTVASYRQNNSRMTTLRPRTMESTLSNGNRVTSETRLRSHIPTLKTDNNANSRTGSILQSNKTRTLLTKPATRVWRY